MTDYERIAKAIAFLTSRVTAQPGLQELADHLHLSPFHTQRLFQRWAGTSPKRFLQVLTLELGKKLLDESYSVLAASEEAGLSSSSRLYDHFVQLEGVTPGEYRRRGSGLDIRHGLTETPFGMLFIASTPRGICMASFIDKPQHNEALSTLQQQWPAATLIADQALCRQQAADMFSASRAEKRFPLHVQGTNFQLAVWRALLGIAPGTAVSYRQIAEACGRPKASRAVGNAIGANPVAILIPCHRVIQQSGALGGYRWSPERKLALQTWEVLSNSPQHDNGQLSA